MSNLKKWVMIPLLLLALAFASPVWAATTAQTEHEEALLDAFQLLRDLHVQKVDEETLIRAAVQGMLNELNDPYTEYFTAEEYQEFIDGINQKYAGVGMRLREENGAFYVDEVFPNTPAEKAGIKPNDRIVAVDGKSVKGEEIGTVSGWIRGNEGTSVTITFERKGVKNPFNIKLVRAPIQLPTITSSMEGKTGYIRIYSFSDNVGWEFQAHLASLIQKGASSLILDLRGNSGGFLDGAISVADQFLKEGLILKVQSRSHSQEYRADSKGNDLPLVVLIDQNSASASEVVAGALQANKRALLIGSRSYGKGVVQQSYQLTNEHVLKLTVSQYYLANGQSPHKTGLTPDIPVLTKPLQMPIALLHLAGTTERKLVFSLADRTMTLNQYKVEDQPVIKENGKYYIPLRATLEALGDAVVWDEKAKEIKVEHQGQTFQMNPQFNRIKRDGKNLPLNKPLLQRDGTVYLSLEAVKAVLKPDELNLTSSSIGITVRTK